MLLFWFKEKENTKSTWHALLHKWRGILFEVLILNVILVIYLYKHMWAHTITETHALTLWSFENGSHKSLKAHQLATKEGACHRCRRGRKSEGRSGRKGSSSSSGRGFNFKLQQMLTVTFSWGWAARSLPLSEREAKKEGSAALMKSLLPKTKQKDVSVRVLFAFFSGTSVLMPAGSLRGSALSPSACS